MIYSFPITSNEIMMSRGIMVINAEGVSVDGKITGILSQAQESRPISRSGKSIIGLSIWFR
jgi:hypothetical protein